MIKGLPLCFTVIQEIILKHQFKPKYS